MLENGNVEMLGGGESTNADTNYEKTLCRALGLPVNDNGGENSSGQNGNDPENNGRNFSQSGNGRENSDQVGNVFCAATLLNSKKKTTSHWLFNFLE